MIKTFIKKYRVLFLLFLISLIASFLITFPLSKVPEIFEFGSELGKYVYDISIGYVVSYIFFFLVVFLKEENDKKHVNERVSLQCSSLIIEGYDLYSNVFNTAEQYKKHFPPTKEEIEFACKSINPFISPVGYNEKDNMPWEWLLKHRRTENINHIEKIKSLRYIESDLFGLLSRIEDCRLFYLASKMAFPKTPQNHFKDGTFMENDLFVYFSLIKELEDYVEKYFKEFTSHKKLRQERIKSNMEY